MIIGFFIKRSIVFGRSIGLRNSSDIVDLVYSYSSSFFNVTVDFDDFYCFGCIGFNCSKGFFDLIRSAAIFSGFNGSLVYSLSLVLRVVAGGSLEWETEY